LMKKYQSHPIGSKSFPPVNETFFPKDKKE